MKKGRFFRPFFKGLRVYFSQKKEKYTRIFCFFTKIRKKSLILSDFFQKSMEFFRARVYNVICAMCVYYYDTANYIKEGHSP